MNQPHHNEGYAPHTFRVGYSRIAPKAGQQVRAHAVNPDSTPLVRALCGSKIGQLAPEGWDSFPPEGEPPCRACTSRWHLARRLARSKESGCG